MPLCVHAVVGPCVTVHPFDWDQSNKGHPVRAPLLPLEHCRWDFFPSRGPDVNLSLNATQSRAIEATVVSTLGRVVRIVSANVPK